MKSALALFHLVGNKRSPLAARCDFHKAMQIHVFYGLASVRESAAIDAKRSMTILSKKRRERRAKDDGVIVMSSLKTVVRCVAATTLLAGPVAAVASDALPPAPSTNPLYRLVQPEMALPGGGAQFGGFRVETFTSLAPRHEVRLSAEPGLGMPASAFDSWSGRGMGYDLGTTRATYRYVVSQSPDWAWKVGITANLREMSESLRAAASLTPPSFGGLPLLHVAGEGRLSPRWSMAFDADGLITGRGRAVDVGVRVDYALSRTFTLFGGYRLNESSGEAYDDVLNTGFVSSARFGLRYRF